MITPRRTRLFRVADLAAFRSTLCDWILALTPEEARDTFVLVPTRAAAEQLRRTVEDRGLRDDGAALVWPIVATRHDLHEELAARLASPPHMLSAFEREVILSAVSRDLIEEGVAPPFVVRPGLIAEMLALYDQIRRLGRTTEDFERNFRDELEREQDTDRGAARLLQQTEFLAAAFRAYANRSTEGTDATEQIKGGASPGRPTPRRADEHSLREMLLGAVLARPLRRVVVTVADRLADPDGLWPADYDLLTRLSGLTQVDLVCTEAVLAAGFVERLHAAFPDLDDERSAYQPSPPPLLVAPPAPTDSDGATVHLSFRDREEELAAIARRLKTDHHSAAAPDGRPAVHVSLDRTAIVVRRPLPYLYLARDVFSDAAIPFETLDTLPLAAEPYAAALDLVLDAVASDFTRTSLLALLRSPHFDLGVDDHVAVGACEFALAEARYLGGLERLQLLVAGWEQAGPPRSREERRQATALPAARAVLDAALALRPLAGRRLMTEQIATVVRWLKRHDRPGAAVDPTRSRRLRVRAAVLGALTALGQAHERHDSGAMADVDVLTAAIRRWLGSQTFAARTGEAGLQILDAQAARYGDFDDLQIVGLIEGEWPERVRRNVLYPSSLLSLLEPLPAVADPRRLERDVLQSGRAAFKDLVFSPASRIRLSAFSLENDAVVEPSILLDDVAGFGLPVERREPAAARVSFAAALALDPRRPEVVPAAAAAWAAARASADERNPAGFRGEAGAWRFPRVSVSRLERYLDCPFRFFASEVLRLEEEPEDEDTRTPLERGRFLHELWEQFFAEWQRRGYGRVEPEQLPEARALFEELCESALATLTPAEAALERNRLLGSAVSPGIAHRVFAMEAGRPARITERLLEYPLQGDFTFRTHAGATRTITLSAKVDRIDVLADGSLRVIDYKSRQTPDLKQALQLPIYSLIARESLRATRGEPFTIGEALYLSFEGDKAVVPLRAKGKTLDALIDDAQDRLVTALDRIADGHFPPTPARKSLCGPCPYRAVCRLEFVEAVGAAGDEDTTDGAERPERPETAERPGD